MTTETPIKIQIVKTLSTASPSRIVAVKADGDNGFSLFVTDKTGIPYPLKDLQNNVIITNTDGNLQITSSSTNTNINLASSILATINSALQSGGNISELVNDVGYLVQSDIINYTNEDAQDAVGTILVDTTTIDFTYNDTTPSISADVKLNSIDATHLANNINVSKFTNDSGYITLADVDGTDLTYSSSLTDGTIISSTGSDAIIPLASIVNAGLISPQEKQNIASAIQLEDLANVATSGNYEDLNNIPTTFNPTPHTHPISDIVNLQTNLDLKQDNLVSGTSIKTLEGQSLLGSGNINLTKLDVGLANVPNTDFTSAVAANTAKTTNQTHTGDATGATVLTLATVNSNVGSFGTASNVPQYTVNAKGLTTASANIPIQIAESQVINLVADLSNKQATLVSGTNIRTINGNTLLGATDLTIPVATDATTLAKGIVQLAGDLGGTADLPTVPALATKANLASPSLTGTPTAPTPTAGSVGTQIATKEYVLANAGVTSTGTTNRIPKFTSSNSLGDSGLIQVGGNIGMGSAVVPGELFHIGDGNILLEGGGEVAQKFKRDFTTTGENLGVPTGSGISVNPIFQVGRIIQAGDGDPEIRIMYSDDNTSERTVFEVDRKGIAASVKTSIGSHFEGFASLTDVNPKFRLNSYPRMRLEMGAGGNDITDVAVERGATGSLDFFTNSAYRGGFDSSGNLNLLNTPTAPTAPAGTNTTQIATTAFVNGGLATKENAFSKNTAFNKNFGTTAGTVVEGNDSRLSDSRTPTAGSNSYIQNQNASAQSANMWISGTYMSTCNADAYNIELNKTDGFGSSLALKNSSLSSNSLLRMFKPNNTDFYDLYTTTTGVALNGTVTATSFNGSATLTGTPTAPTATAGTNTTQIATTAFVQENSRPYKVYTALLTQSGTNAPTATVLENTLGGTVVWSRVDTGMYLATLTGAFTGNKTVSFFQTGSSSAGSTYTYNSYKDSDNSVRLYALSNGSYLDQIIAGQIEIRVYN